MRTSGVRDHARTLPAQPTRVDRTALIVARVLRRLSGGRIQVFRYYLVAQPVPETPLLPEGRGRNITIRELGPGDPALGHFPRPAQVMESRFAQGAVCYAAFRGDAPIGFIWFCPGDYEEDEVRCLFRPLPAGAAAWDFDVYIADRHRLGPAFAKLWDAASADMRRRGVGWTLSRISAFNPQSLAAHARLGARALGRLTFLGAGSLQLMAGGCPPYVHGSLWHGRRPVIPVRAPASKTTGEKGAIPPNA